MPWDDNEEFYQAWDEGRTGYPWIDAIMRQLHEQGWMHHLARHSVVRYLAYHPLQHASQHGKVMAIGQSCLSCHVTCFYIGPKHLVTQNLQHVESALCGISGLLLDARRSLW